MKHRSGPSGFILHPSAFILRGGDRLAEALRQVGMTARPVEHALQQRPRFFRRTPGRPCLAGLQPDRQSRRFLRLRSGGVLAGGSAREARLRCRLYELYLGRHLL